MATGHFIREGDKTYCGGKVLAGNRGTVMNGMPHAREGDPVTCGKDGKTYEIVGGVNIIISNGKRPAGTLDSVSTCPCRARFISSLKHTYEKADKPVQQGHKASAQTVSESNISPATTPRAPDPIPPVAASSKPCNHPDRMEELASYIADEMNRNINHPSVLEMKELNSYDPVAETREYMALPFYKRLGRQPDFHSFALAKQARAFALWTERVGQNRPWDHKPKIESRFGDYWHKQGNYEYYYDIWSNIHYGYIGIAAGFSEAVLSDGAGAEQIVSDTVRKISDWENKPGPHRSADIAGLRAWDDIPDRKSIIIGINFFAAHPSGGITAEAIMNEVLAGDPAEWGEGIEIHKCE